MTEQTTYDVVYGALQKQTLALRLVAEALSDILAVFEQSPEPEDWVRKNPPGFRPDPR